VVPPPNSKIRHRVETTFAKVRWRRTRFMVPSWIGWLVNQRRSGADRCPGMGMTCFASHLGVASRAFEHSRATTPVNQGASWDHDSERRRAPEPRDSMTDDHARPRSRTVAGKRRAVGWLESDLVGIAATLYTFAVLAVSLAVFRFAGPLAGLGVAVAVWIPMFVFAIRERGKPPARLDVAGPSQGPRHRVLVVANRGLEDPALCREVCRREERTAPEVMIVAPVVASSRLRTLSGDVDHELKLAGQRVDAALQTLSAAGVQASGRTDIAEPMDSLLDGLREFPPNEVVMLSGGEARWDSAGALAERVRAEVGLPVTEVRRSVS
jgi:hypothetical protein